MLFFLCFMATFLPAGAAGLAVASYGLNAACISFGSVGVRAPPDLPSWSGVRGRGREGSRQNDCCEGVQPYACNSPGFSIHRIPRYLGMMHKKDTIGNTSTGNLNSVQNRPQTQMPLGLVAGRPQPLNPLKAIALACRCAPSDGVAGIFSRDKKWLRRKGKERREPVFDVAPAVEPDDDEAPPPRRSKSASSGGSPRRAQVKSKRKSSSGGSSGSWSVGALIGRTVYWGAVGGLWMVIAAIGVADLDRRPPAADPIAGSSQAPADHQDRRRHRPAARHPRRRWAVGVVPLKELPPYRAARPSSPSRTAASIRTTASTRSASPARSSPTCCAAACRRAARP